MRMPLKILIVDDNLADATLVGRYLEEQPLWLIDCSICETAEEAIAESRKFLPDIAIVDYHLGRETGIDLISSLKKNGVHAGFILLTGVGSEKVAVDAIHSGVDDYIMKDDLSPRLLERSLRHVIGQRQAVEAVKKEREFMQSVIDGINEPIMLINTNHQVISLNEAAKKSSSRQSGKSESLKCYQLSDFDKCCEDLGHVCVLEEVKKTGKSVTKVHKHFDKNGKTVFTEHNGSPLWDTDGSLKGIIELSRDVTERKAAEEERSRFATTIHQAWEIIVITDVEGTIQYVNPAFEQITGYKKEEAIGENPRILKSGKHDAEFYRKLWKTIKGGKVWRGHFINKKKDGTLYEEDATITPVYDSSGNMVNFVAVKRDVTKEMMLERQFIQTQKMEAIGTLAGGIAHDFNNILTPIIGYAELLINELPKESSACECANEIIKASRRAKELTKHILDFSHQTEQEMKPIQLHLIVKEALNLLRAFLPTTIDIRQNIDSNSGTVLADETQMHQIVMNLCTNAEHAMRENGGVLEVTLKATDVEKNFVASTGDVKKGSYVKLGISDAGHGMDSVIVDRIFDPFFTTKKVGEGTGMGLAAVHGIVTSHGGAITVDSRLGKGTTFNVYIPKIKSVSAQETQLLQEIPGGDESILYVDDEEKIVILGRRILKKLGYKVTVRTNGMEALELFRTDPLRFDLVITDQTMPKMTGDVLARELMVIRPDIPVILCTGFSHTVTAEKAREIGIKEYLMKPIIPRVLGETVRRVLDEKGKVKLNAKIVV